MHFETTNRIQTSSLSPEWHPISSPLSNHIRYLPFRSSVILGRRLNDGCFGMQWDPLCLIFEAITWICVESHNTCFWSVNSRDCICGIPHSGLSPSRLIKWTSTSSVFCLFGQTRPSVSTFPPPQMISERERERDRERNSWSWASFCVGWMSVSCNPAGLHRGREYDQDWKHSDRVQGPHSTVLLLRAPIVQPGRTVPHISGQDRGYLHIFLCPLLPCDNERD